MSLENLTNKTVEFHIIHSFPVNCLNRDDENRLKTVNYGGTTRQRISSQCMKRAARSKMENTGFKCVPVQLKNLLENKLKDAGCPDQKIQAAEKLISSFFCKNSKADNLLIHISCSEIDKLISKLQELGWDDKDKNINNELKSAVLNQEYEDDIALFGRMVAQDANFTVEGAMSFSHPISVHKINVEEDFYSASADKQIDDNNSGAVNLGEKEYAASTMYKYFNINLNTLIANKNGNEDAIKKILNYKFLEKFIIAVPSAHQHDMAALTRPSYVLMVIRGDQPFSIDFEKAIKYNEDKSYSEQAEEVIKNQINKWKTGTEVLAESPVDIDRALTNLFN